MCNLLVLQHLELSLCSENRIMLTPGRHSLIVALGGKKRVKVGAYHRRRLKEEGQGFEALPTSRWTTKVGWRYRNAPANRLPIKLTGDWCSLPIPVIACSSIRYSPVS